MMSPPSLANSYMSLTIINIFGGKSFLKLKDVPIALLPKLKLDSKDVLYIINLLEKGGIVESVTNPDDVDGTLMSLSNSISPIFWMIVLDNSLPLRKYFMTSFSPATWAKPVINFIPEVFESIAS